MKKILFITGTHSHGGGAEAVLADLVNHLDSEKYGITIQEIMHYHVKRTKTNDSVKIRKRAVLDTKFPLRLFNSLNIYLINRKPEILSEIFALNGYDVVLAWNGEKSPCLLYGTRAKNKIAWFHGSLENLDVKKHPAMKERNALLKRAYGVADRIVTISNMSFKSLENLFPEYAKKTLIIHNMCDIEKIQSDAAKETVAFENDGRNIICAGRLDKNKNFPLLIEATKVLKDEGMIVHLHILGSGEELENLRSKAKTLGVDDQVHFHGFIQNPAPYIKASDVMCISSFSEGWPTVAVEAMAIGKPFVTTTVAGSSEELSDNGRCGLVADWNANDYAEKIKVLLSDGALYEKMSKACIEKIKEYTPEKTVADFDKLIAEVGKTPSVQTAVPKIGKFKSHAFYMLYSVFDVAKIKQGAGFLKKIKKQKTIYGKKLPTPILFLVGVAAFCGICVLIPILLLPRAFATAIYLGTMGGGE